MKIIYEDDSIIVCHKEASEATQTKAIGQQDLVSKLSNYRAKKGEKPEVFVIHRLDQPVEGVMVFAKDSKSAAALSKQVSDHTFKKKYYAIITSDSLEPEGELRDYLIKDAKTNLASVVSKDRPGAKSAGLSYKIIDSWDDKKLLDIELYTGRHHQIRVQLASRKAPILGDVKYGGIDTKKPLCLCSYYIGFEHPKTKKMVEYNIKPIGEGFYGGNIL